MHVGHSAVLERGVAPAATGTATAAGPDAGNPVDVAAVDSAVLGLWK